MKPNIPRAPVGTLDPAKLNFKDAQVELQRCTNCTQEKTPLINNRLPSPGSIKCIKLIKKQVPEWMQNYQASTAAGWGHEPRIPHSKPSGGDQPDKKQSHQEPNTKGTENHQKPNTNKWEPRAKGTYVTPEKNKRKTLEPWHLHRTNHKNIDTFQW